MDWPRTWDRARRNGLPSDLSSMLYRTLHNCLPTEEKKAKFGKGDGSCKGCKQPFKVDMYHCMLECSKYKSYSDYLLKVLKTEDPSMSPGDALYLSFVDMEVDKELAMLTIIAAGWQFIWKQRVKKEPLKPNEHLKGELIMRAEVLNNTAKYRNTAQVMLEMVHKIPP